MNTQKLTKIKEKDIEIDTLVITRKTRLWCQLPYPNHKNGCPNYNKNPLCPPHSPFSINFAYFNYFRLIYAIFDFKQYKEIRKLEKPHWSDAQIRCVLYWQSSIKKLLKDHIKSYYNNISPDYLYLLGCGSGFKLINQSKIYSMESVGIDVFKTLKNNYIDFELKPKNKVVLVCLLCSHVDFNNIESLI